MINRQSHAFSCNLKIIALANTGCVIARAHSQKHVNIYTYWLKCIYVRELMLLSYVPSGESKKWPTSGCWSLLRWLIWALQTGSRWCLYYDQCILEWDMLLLCNHPSVVSVLSPEPIRPVRDLKHGCVSVFRQLWPSEMYMATLLPRRGILCKKQPINRVV